MTQAPRHSRDGPGHPFCNEPIHTPGTIQPHGMLIAVDPSHDMAIAALSANVPLDTGRPPHHHTVHGLLGPEFTAQLHEHARSGTLRIEAPWTTCVDSPGDREPFDAAVHLHAGLIVIELEPADPADPGHAVHATRHLGSALGTIRAEQGGLEPLGLAVARSIRQITGFERVLIYRFDESWNGQAIAEDRAADWRNPLVGLHFPASDIPAPARALYRIATLRTVHSRDAEQVPLLSMPHWPGEIDLSHARLRSLSPSHMQYHRHLGVDGSMSVSIMVGDHLWGLVICHHRRPHRTSAGQRTAAAAVVDAFAQRIGPAERAGAESERRQKQDRLSRLITHMARADDLTLALTGGPVTALDMFGASGAALAQGSEIAPMGVVPDQPTLRRLIEWLRVAAPAGDVFETDSIAGSISGLAPDLAPDPAVASGLLAVFLTDDRSDILLWVRPSHPVELSWGGNPAESHGIPRTSFEPWPETRHDAARPWTRYEIEIATLLRHAITEVVVRNLRRLAALNDQLRQSQKMEAVGQLTGGMAHDFNNLLGGISGSLEIARTRLAQGRVAELDRYLAAAAGAADRAAALTNRLLAFSRRQTLDPHAIDVNRLVASMEDLVRRTVGSTIDVEVTAAAGLWTVLCDVNQLENALLNLALNARDAMPGGGRLMFETANTRLDPALAMPFGMPAGDYVTLSVVDTGLGMDSDTASRAFEPFFTTKPLGKGTGLGLSMVYGFARQSGGQARILSEPGEGTTVRLYLPRHLGPVETDGPAGSASRPADGPMTVLVVDDEPVLRMLVCEVLRERGLSVLEAADGPSALVILGSGRTLDLLVTDVGLPGGLNGRQLAEAARAERPELKILFITGYAENAALSGGLLDPVTQVLTKPFSMEALLGKVLPMVA